MLQRIKLRTRTYEMEGGVYVDIAYNDRGFNAYLYYLESSHKLYMFGMPTEQVTLNDFKRIVENTYKEYLVILDEQIEALQNYYDSVMAVAKAKGIRP